MSELLLEQTGHSHTRLLTLHPNTDADHSWCLLLVTISRSINQPINQSVD